LSPSKSKLVGVSIPLLPQVLPAEQMFEDSLFWAECEEAEEDKGEGSKLEELEENGIVVTV